MIINVALGRPRIYLVSPGLHKPPPIYELRIATLRGHGDQRVAVLVMLGAGALVS